MIKPIFEGNDFSFFFEKGTGQFTLYWAKYDDYMILKDEDALLFKQLIEIAESSPEEDRKRRIERTISIQYYFRYACPIPRFIED